MRVSVLSLRRGASVFALAATTAVFPVHAMAQDADPAPIPSPGMCVYGFSKVIEGAVDNTFVSVGCGIGPLASCRTAVSDSAISFAYKSSGSQCQTGVLCDESRELGGKIAGKVRINARGQQPCPSRGAYEGPVELTDAAGTVIASGRLQATLGVGTHQKPCQGPTCPTPTRPVCETCYDVKVAQNQWTLGTEGLINASVTAGRYRGCRIRASFQADYTTALAGPLADWRARGNLDGVMECPCGTPDPIALEE
jgi:hypothetical protein